MDLTEKYLSEKKNTDEIYRKAVQDMKKAFSIFSKTYMKTLETMLFNKHSNKKLVKNRDATVDGYQELYNAIMNHLKALDNEPQIYKRR